MLQHEKQSGDIYVKQTCEDPDSDQIQSCSSVLENKENLYSPVTSCEISARDSDKQVSIVDVKLYFILFYSKFVK